MFYLTSPISMLALFVTSGVSLYALLARNDLIESWALHPYSVVRKKEYWRLITSGFIHGDMMHLLFNMITLYFFAVGERGLEDNAGSLRFFLIYFVSMIVSDISTVIKRKDDYGYRSIGASGAVSGILFAAIMYNPTMKIFFFFIPIPIPAWIFAILYLVYSYTASRKSQDFINHEAHFWGAGAGAALAIILDPAQLIRFFNVLF